MICQYCNQPAKFVPNEEIYNGKRYGRSYMMYYCKPCDAYVGVHENDPKRPLGTLANRELREWRKKAHRVIDPYWRDGDMKRVWVYSRLNRHFKKSVHVGESDQQMCEEIIRVTPALMLMTKEEFNSNYPKD